MEKIKQENDEKKEIKISQNENQKFLSERNNSNVLNNKNISYIFDHTKFKHSRLFGINFYHIGNLYVFGFMGKNSEPLFSTIFLFSKDC